MILRIARAVVRAGGIDELRSWLASDAAPTVGMVPGLRRLHVGLRQHADEHLLVIVSAWDSMDAILGAFGPDPASRATLLDPSGQLRTVTVDHYELDEVIDQVAAGRPTVIRISSGWIAEGPDAEIQQELRRRVRGLTGELVDAYIARRMRERSVEVAFVATWMTAPPDRTLEGAIWPDLSARYRSFTVETYEPLAIRDDAG